VLRVKRLLDWSVVIDWKCLKSSANSAVKIIGDSSI
jgi:hypothetical protein